MASDYLSDENIEKMGGELLLSWCRIDDDGPAESYSDAEQIRLVLKALAKNAADHESDTMFPNYWKEIRLALEDADLRIARVNQAG